MHNKFERAVSLWIAIFAITLLGLPKAQAQTDVPRTISYQGLLSYSGSAVQDGPYLLTFRLYSDSIRKNLLWQDSYLTNVRSGIFSVLLGSGAEALPVSSEMDQQVWLGTQINSGPELRPVIPLSSVPYALNVANGAITTTKIAAGAVTADKLSLNYISGFSVEGRAVAEQNSLINFKGAGGIELTYDQATHTMLIGIPTGALVSTPVPLLANANNYTIDPRASYIRLTNANSATIMVTGIDHSGVVNGRAVTLANIGVSAILLKQRSAFSANGNQFELPGASDVILAAHGSATFVYDAALGVWKLVATD